MAAAAAAITADMADRPMRHIRGLLPQATSRPGPSIGEQGQSTDSFAAQPLRDTDMTAIDHHKAYLFSLSCGLAWEFGPCEGSDEEVGAWVDRFASYMGLECGAASSARRLWFGKIDPGSGMARHRFSCPACRRMSLPRTGGRRATPACCCCGIRGAPRYLLRALSRRQAGRRANAAPPGPVFEEAIRAGGLPLHGGPCREAGRGRDPRRAKRCGQDDLLQAASLRLAGARRRHGDRRPQRRWGLPGPAPAHVERFRIGRERLALPRKPFRAAAGDVLPAAGAGRRGRAPGRGENGPRRRKGLRGSACPFSSFRPRSRFLSWAGTSSRMPCPLPPPFRPSGFV